MPTPRPADPLDPFRLAWNSEDYPNWPMAGLLALTSDKAYLPPVNVQTAFQSLGFTTVMTFLDGSTVGYVVSAGDVTVIVFRGTDDGGDWLINLNEFSTQLLEGQIHTGFYNAYQRLKPQIISLIGQPKHLWITGHSLGGALAVVCAYDLIERQHLSVDGVVTFGQPMVARKDFAKYLDRLLLGRYVHYVNDADIVPRVPPSYSHCGSLVWFTPNGIERSKPKSYGAPPTGEFPDDQKIIPLSERQFQDLKAELRAKNAGPKRGPDGTPIYEGNSQWIRDHSMELYLDKIRSITVGIGRTQP